MPTMLFCRFGLGVCIIFAFFLKQSASVPAQRNSAKEKVGFEEIVQTNKKSSQKLFEGDIVPTWFEEEVENGKYNMRQKRDARRMLQYIWRTREVPYELTSDYDKAENDSIKNALKVFEAKTCLKFKVHTTERDWIQFRKMDGCFSAVGRQFWRAGAQIVSLGNGCLGEATILHEVMHALGFWHEQSRPDRDRYVEVLWENIDTDEMHNFNKYSHLEADVLGVNYDYQTMMHYGNKAFSKNGQPTMKAIGNPNLVLGTASTLSPSDITQINALYDCKSKYGSIWSSWSSYSPCDTYCQKTRQRFCFHSDLKQCSGANEHGIVTERLKCTPKECNVPIDGHWGRWTSWGKCDQSCGNGKKKRTRSCSDPSPKNGGKPCPGDSVSTADCFIKNCGLGKNDCEFDGQAWCFWKKYPDVFSYFMWSRKKGSTPSSMTGPSGDHTSGNGYYLYVEASSPAKRGDKARIISNEMKATNGVCFTFWYHMHGLTMGNLRVFLLDSKNGETEVLMLSGDKGNQWLNANKTIISKLPFKVIIEAENGPGYLSDIAIDDVKFKAGKCEKSSMEIKCGVEAKSLGCYAESGSNRVMPELLDSHRDAVRGHKNFMIDWNNYPKSVETLLCHCAQRAKAKGHKYFALQYYAECWSGPGEIDYKKYGSSKQCVDEKYQECTAFSNEEHCAGGNDANYVYQLV